MTMTKLDATVARIRELETEIAELEALLDSEKDRIKAEMIEAGEDTLTGTGWTASWTTAAANASAARTRPR